MTAPENSTGLSTAPGTKQHYSATSLPGLSAETIEGLKPLYPGSLNEGLLELIMRTSGIGGTASGSLDITGHWHDEEPIAVFRPSLTLTIDDEGRRWVAEGAFGNELPGPVWCIFPHPQVALQVSDDLASFLSDFNEKSFTGGVEDWLTNLSTAARTVWKHRTKLARRSSGVTDPTLRAWASGLPVDALVYDLRSPTLARGWPYGAAGPSGRLYRCGRSPVSCLRGEWPPRL